VSDRREGRRGLRGGPDISRSGIPLDGFLDLSPRQQFTI